MARDPKLFINAMNREHRTIQQNMAGLMLAWFAHLATLPESHYDLRNTDSVNAAKTMMKALDGTFSFQKADGSWHVGLRTI
jgi:hypothetical protein